MAKLLEMPHCCTMLVLCDLGGTETAMGRWDKISKKDLIKEIKKVVENRWDINLLAKIVATTNNQQKEANKALKSLGFSCTRYTEKIQHEETRVRLWNINVQTLLENLRKV